MTDEELLKTLRPNVWAHVEGQYRVSMLEDARAIEAAATAPLLERIAALEAERDEADRRSGNAERTKQEAIDDMCKRASWLDKAKLQWGVDRNVSFDVVWAECLALKPKVAELEAALSKAHQINFRRHTSADAACAALEAKLAQRVPDGMMLLDRKLATDCLAGMKYAAHWERDRDGRPPSQVCCFEIRDLEAALAASPQPQPSSHDALRCSVGNCMFNGEVATHAPGCPQAPQPVQPSEQAAFEDWLYRVCPSGDVTEVQRQWEASSDLADWLASQRTEDVLIDGVAYTVPVEVACELLRLHMVAQASNAQQAEAQEPLSGQSRFRGDSWTQCTVEHVRMVQANPEEWADGYEVRMLFTRPQPAQLQALSEEEAITAWRGVKDVGDDKYNAILLGEAIQSALAAKNGAVLK